MATKSKRTAKTVFDHYHALKRERADEILLFKRGDFYEAFYGDAEIVAKLIGLTLVTRKAPGDEEIPMSGFPHWMLDNCLRDLIRAGHRVAVCEQVETLEQATRGRVKRQTTTIVTP